MPGGLKYPLFFSKGELRRSIIDEIGIFEDIDAILNKHCTLVLGTLVALHRLRGKSDGRNYCGKSFKRGELRIDRW